MKVILTLLMLLSICKEARAIEDQSAQNLYAKLQAGDISAMPEFRANAAELPWFMHYVAAMALYNKQPGEEAIKWFYTGQFRARVASHFDQHPDGTSALAASLNDVIGQPINQFAGSDKTLWLNGIDAAIAWTQAHPYTFAQLQADLDGQTIAPEDLQSSIATNMKGVMGLRESIAKLDPAELKRQRQQNGLE